MLSVVAKGAVNDHLFIAFENSFEYHPSFFCHSILLKMRQEMSDTNDFNILRHAMPIHALLCAKRKPFVEIQYASTPLSVLIL